MTPPAPALSVRPPLWLRIAAAAQAAAVGLAVLLDPSAGPTIAQGFVLTAEVCLTLRTWRVEVRTAGDDEVLVRNPASTSRLRRSDLDSAMVARTGHLQDHVWAVHLVQRDGTRIPAVATVALFRPAAVRGRLERQARDLDAWIRRDRPPRWWEEPPRHALDASTDLYGDR